MAAIRKPFQGVWNIVRFNWHFYLISVGLIIGILFINDIFPSYHIYGNIALGLILLPTTISLLVSFYVYDLSDLYKLSWLDKFDTQKKLSIVNINAGFDETSILLADKFPKAHLSVFDFYNPLKHTEVSIKRARKAYPPFPNTRKIDTSSILLKDVDIVFLILSAHEIRNEKERIAFFRELKVVLKTHGRIIVVEHLRDLPNFLAYNIGFFHFLSEKSWHRTFEQAGLVMIKEEKINPFIATFILE